MEDTLALRSREVEKITMEMPADEMLVQPRPRGLLVQIGSTTA